MPRKALLGRLKGWSHGLELGRLQQRVRASCGPPAERGGLPAYQCGAVLPQRTDMPQGLAQQAP